MVALAVAMDDRPAFRLVGDDEYVSVEEIGQALLEQRRLADAEIDHECADHRDPLLRLRDDAVALVSEYEARREQRGDVPDEGCLGCVVRRAIGLAEPVAERVIYVSLKPARRPSRVWPNQMAFAL